jgi:hypothetical protein
VQEPSQDALVEEKIVTYKFPLKGACTIKTFADD